MSHPLFQALGMRDLRVQYLALDEVHPNAYNPNRQNDHSFELLCKSIQEDGFTVPIIVDAHTMEIVDGQHRWEAAQLLGLLEVPCIVVPMSEVQRRIATLRHNRTRGNEDEKLATEVLRELQKLDALDWAADSLGLSDFEVSRLSASIERELSGVGAPPAPKPEPTKHEPVREIVQPLPDKEIFRLFVYYSGEEADLVNSVFLKYAHKSQTDVVLDLCRKAAVEGVSTLA